MGIPIDKLVRAVRSGIDIRRSADENVRIAVFVDRSASAFLVSTLRDALVPQTPSALVRVDPINRASTALRPDTDLALVVSCGSEGLERAVQDVIVAGVPTVVVAESSVEVPFIARDTRMLGLITATDSVHLLDSLARWILDHTEKDVAFARNFPFMRVAASFKVVASASAANLATGALVFIPGADFPVMTLTQVGMMLRLAGIHGKPLKSDRLYELAGVIGAALGLRGLARFGSSRVPRASFAIKALIGGVGTLAVGLGLSALYERDIDYTPINDALAHAIGALRSLSGHGTMQRDADRAPFLD